MSCKGVGGLGTDSPSTTNHHKRLFIYVMLMIVFGIHLLAQANGEYPQSGVIRDSAGNLYGTALGGVPTPGGVVYKLSPSGDEEVLYTFCSKTPGCADGNVPSGGVVRDPQGNLYGATLEGGKFNRDILYELIPSGDKYDEEVLYDFCSKPGCTDGALPNPGLIRDSLGNLYGTTNAGGTHGIGGLGVIFKFSTSTRLYQSLYNFCSELNCTDGRAPTTGVIRDEKGNLYGTTPNGGNGYGVAYELSATKIYSVIYTFCEYPACLAYPQSGLVRDLYGNLYGTASPGLGGWAYELSPPKKGNKYVATWSLGVGIPTSGVILESGYLYGTALGEYGFVYKVKPGSTKLDGFFTFANGLLDGNDPRYGVIMDGGNLYGTTYYLNPAYSRP